MEAYLDGIWLTRLLVQKGMAAVYFIAFLSAYNQFPALLGEKGLLPAPGFLARVRFANYPSLFHWHYSDRFFKTVCAGGMLLSLLAILGLSERGPLWLSMAVWLTLWVLYLSIVSIGQRFYSFGWESMLLEAGFITSFLGSAGFAPSPIPVLALRWMLFRTELGAGLIKLRHDRCWRKLTCLDYHYETQPLPNPLSWFFHRLPRCLHRISVLFSHFVQIVVPFGLFAPQPVSCAAGALILLHQLWLVFCGNYSWLNWLTIVLSFSALSDEAIRLVLPLGTPETVEPALWFVAALYAFAGIVVVLSYQPVVNLFSKNQLMNYCYNPFHLINTYGAFGSITRERYEIVIEGCSDETVTDQTQWREYEFRAKPGRVDRCPPVVAPYHLRLDWLMWFLPFRVQVTSYGIFPGGYETWFIRLVEKLLEGDAKTLALLKGNPFPGKPPKWIRATYYRYQYTNWHELWRSKAWWKRECLGEYLPPISLRQITR